MKRWHLTLLLGLLAAGGVALAVSLPVVGLPGTPVEPTAGPGPAVAPVSSAAPVPSAAPVVVAPLVEVGEPPIESVRPAPVARPGRVVDGAPHPIHVVRGERGGAIPELSEPARRVPVVRELPPDPPPVHPDGCPACGMG